MYSRRLSHSPELVAGLASSALASSASAREAEEKKSRSQRLFDEWAGREFAPGVPRGSICHFIAGRAEEVDEWAVTVTSILQFAPGMRVAVAVEEDAVDAYKR